MRSLSLRSGNSPTTPYGGRVNGLQLIGFPPPCHPNYRALALTPAGLSPAERASLCWTHKSLIKFSWLPRPCAIRNTCSLLRFRVVHHDPVDVPAQPVVQVQLLVVLVAGFFKNDLGSAATEALTYEVVKDTGSTFVTVTVDPTNGSAMLGATAVARVGSYSFTVRAKEPGYRNAADANDDATAVAVGQWVDKEFTITVKSS